MREYIKEILEDDEYTQEEKQDMLDDYFIDRLRERKFDECKELFAAGARLESQFYADYYFDVLQTKFLVENKIIDMNLKDENGKTLYSYAECGYDITRKKGYKQVMDYLAFKGAKKIVFNDQEKAFLRCGHKERCELVGRVECGQMPKESVKFYEIIKVQVKFGLLEWGSLEQNKNKTKGDREK